MHPDFIIKRKVKEKHDTYVSSGKKIPRKNLAQLRLKYLGDYHGLYKLMLPSRRVMEIEDYPFYDTDEFQQEEETAQPFWTDMFIYWVDEPEVREGSLLAFFTDLNNPNGTEFSMCYVQFQKIRVLSMKVYETSLALTKANETGFGGYRNIKDELFFGI